MQLHTVALVHRILIFQSTWPWLDISPFSYQSYKMWFSYNANFTLLGSTFLQPQVFLFSISCTNNFDRLQKFPQKKVHLFLIISLYKYKHIIRSLIKGVCIRLLICYSFNWKCCWEFTPRCFAGTLRFNFQCIISRGQII